MTCAGAVIPLITGLRHGRKKSAPTIRRMEQARKNCPHRYSTIHTFACAVPTRLSWDRIVRSRSDDGSGAHLVDAMARNASYGHGQARRHAHATYGSSAIFDVGISLRAAPSDRIVERIVRHVEQSGDQL